MSLIDLAESGRMPDFLLRIGMRRLMKKRLQEQQSSPQSTESFLKQLEDQPIAIDTSEANEQHYEVPTRFFLKVLGPRLKYSSCYWPEGVDTLKDAENAMLDLSCKRAGILDGMDILELGCGWGSLTLWMAEQFPRSRILAVSNSATQRAHIMVQAEDRGLTNVEVRTCDMNDFDPEAKFDRIMSIEMFEHMRNPGKLLDRCADWLHPDGLVFLHVFTTSLSPYLFADAGDQDDWMAKYFFSGGMMPSPDLLAKASSRFSCDEDWVVNGEHYSKTLEAWLEKQDAGKADIMPLFEKTYGKEQAEVWFQRWRMFWMASSELFGFGDGTQWPVHHYRLKLSGAS